MSLIINSNGADRLYVNGAHVNKAYLNGTLVLDKYLTPQTLSRYTGFSKSSNYTFSMDTRSANPSDQKNIVVFVSAHNPTYSTGGNALGNISCSDGQTIGAKRSNWFYADGNYVAAGVYVFEDVPNSSSVSITIPREAHAKGISIYAMAYTSNSLSVGYTAWTGMWGSYTVGTDGNFDITMKNQKDDWLFAAASVSVITASYTARPNYNYRYASTEDFGSAGSNIYGGYLHYRSGEVVVNGDVPVSADYSSFLICAGLT